MEVIKKLYFNIKKNIFRTKMITINLIIAIVPLLIFQFIFYIVYFNNVKENVSNTYYMLFDQVNGRLLLLLLYFY